MCRCASYGYHPLLQTPCAASVTCHRFRESLEINIRSGFSKSTSSEFKVHHVFCSFFFVVLRNPRDSSSASCVLVAVIRMTAQGFLHLSGARWPLCGAVALSCNHRRKKHKPGRKDNTHTKHAPLKTTTPYKQANNTNKQLGLCPSRQHGSLPRPPLKSEQREPEARVAVCRELHGQLPLTKMAVRRELHGQLPLREMGGAPRNPAPRNHTLQ